MRACGTCETLETGGLLLGVFPQAVYERGNVRIEPGDVLAFYTDGVTEAMNDAGDMFSEERLVDVLRAIRGQPVREIHDRLLEDVRVFQAGRAPDDDVTLIVVKRNAPASAAA
jgi:sigma-B regulation protein RsbU (phosphoserine phosphatase)